jgi:hypothetical protein
MYEVSTFLKCLRPVTKPIAISNAINKIKMKGNQCNEKFLEAAAVKGFNHQQSNK